MYCDQCGAENRASARFCHKCGTDLSLIPTDEKEVISTAAVETPAPTVEIVESTTREELDTLLNGRYELKELLGRGGMGMVYRAYDLQLRMDIAIKILLTRYIHDFSAIESLKQEAKAAMRLAHPNIVRLYNFEDTPQMKYILMEYIDGESLSVAASQRTGRRLAESEVIRYMTEVCDALIYAHRENIIHRDIKPGNLLLTKAGHVKLADFGIALIHEKADLDSDTAPGTPSYMSPEQIRRRQLDGRTDIYSLGVSMYELLAGRLPFRDKDSRFDVNMMPGPIDGVSDWLNAIIMKCLRTEPDGRWTDAEELRDVLSGKKEGGLGLKAKFKPWWVVAGDLQKNEQAKEVSPAPVPEPQPRKEVLREKRDYSHVEIQRTPPPISSVRVKDRIEKVGPYADLLENASEREQARVAYSMIAGLLSGIIFLLLSAKSESGSSQRMLLHLSFILYGGSFGIAIGLAHRRISQGMISFAGGIIGGIVAGFLIRTVPEARSLVELQEPWSLLLSGAAVGAFLGIADGIHRQSVPYLIQCALWGTAGGAAGCAFFLLIRYLFSAFWSPLPNWIVLGLILGFSIPMGIGLAKKPAIHEEGTFLKLKF
jgi:serine/threonine protein kinase